METPRPYSLLCELTYRCPLQCPYCSNPIGFARHAEELKTEEWERVLGEAAALGVVQAHFSGGEPLLRPDAPRIVRRARDLGLYTNLSTGGTLFDEKMAGQLRDAGLDSLQVSIQDADAANSDRLAGGAPSFEKKTRAARLAKQAGFSLTLNVVLHRQNLDRIEAIIALAGDQGRPRRGLLSRREELALALLARGYTLKEAAKRMRVSPSTVQTFRNRIAEKLDLHGRTDFVRYALAAGILKPDEQDEGAIEEERLQPYRRKAA